MNEHFRVVTYYQYLQSIVAEHFFNELEQFFKNESYTAREGYKEYITFTKQTEVITPNQSINEIISTLQSIKKYLKDNFGVSHSNKFISLISKHKKINLPDYF